MADVFDDVPVGSFFQVFLSPGFNEFVSCLDSISEQAFWRLAPERLSP